MCHPLPALHGMALVVEMPASALAHSGAGGGDQARVLSANNFLDFAARSHRHDERESPPCVVEKAYHPIRHGITNSIEMADGIRCILVQIALDRKSVV